MMYLTVFEQNRHAVSRTSAFSSRATVSGNERRHSVQVITMYGIPFESFPFLGIQNRRRGVLMRSRLCGRGRDQRSHATDERFRMIFSLSVKCVSKHSARHNMACIGSA